MQCNQPNIINPALLWEYDLDTFNYQKSYKIVIERVVQYGNMEEWKAMVNYYTNAQILETVDWSKQLDKRDKDFTHLFLKSTFFDVV